MEHIDQLKSLGNVLNKINNREFDKALTEAEKYIYMTAFHENRFNQSATAKALGVSRGTFRTKLSRYLDGG